MKSKGERRCIKRSDTGTEGTDPFPWGAARDRWIRRRRTDARSGELSEKSTRGERHTHTHGERERHRREGRE